MEQEKHQPTAFVQIERITKNRLDTVFVDGYAWDTDLETYNAFKNARRLAIPFEQADYLLDLYSQPNEQLETICITELGYRTLKSQ